MNIHQLPLDRSEANFSYASFMEHVKWLVEHRKTTGKDQSDRLIEFTALNLKRMERIQKTVALNDSAIELMKFSAPQTWVVITEAWCGDSAQNLPVLAAMADQSGGKIQLHIILRDVYPEWMEHYHTDGTHSIPKLVVFDHEGRQLFTWGPRPAEAQEIVKEWKKNQETQTKDEMELKLHTWYAKNRGQSVIEEMTALIQNFHPVEI